MKHKNYFLNTICGFANRLVSTSFCNSCLLFGVLTFLLLLLPGQVMAKAFFLSTTSHTYWEQENAHFVAAYTLTSDENTWVISDAAVKIADHIFCTTIPDSNIKKIKFRRVNPNDHSAQWNPSAEYDYDANKNCIRITGWDNSSIYETYSYSCPAEMYVVGGAIDGGWGNFKKFTTISTGVYRWQGTLTSNGGDNSCFKFAPQASYSNEYRAEVNNTEFVVGTSYKLVQGGDDRKFKVTTTGTYVITIDLSNPLDQKMTITFPSVPVTGVSLSNFSINKGNTSTLSATVSPDNATNKNVTWSIESGSDKVSISNGKIIGNAAGTAVIKATTEDGGFTATCTVTVIDVQSTVFYVLSKYGHGGSGDCYVNIRASETNNFTMVNPSSSYNTSDNTYSYHMVKLGSIYISSNQYYLYKAEFTGKAKFRVFARSSSSGTYDSGKKILGTLFGDDYNNYTTTSYYFDEGKDRDAQSVSGNATVKETPYAPLAASATTTTYDAGTLNLTTILTTTGTLKNSGAELEYKVDGNLIDNPTQWNATAGEHQVTVDYKGTIDETTSAITLTINASCNVTANFNIVGQLNAGGGSPWQGNATDAAQNPGEGGYFANDHRKITLSTTTSAGFYQWEYVTGSNEHGDSNLESWSGQNAKNATVNAKLPGTYTFKCKAKCAEGDAWVESQSVTIYVPYPEIGVSGPGYNGSWGHAAAGTTGLMTRNGLVWTKTFSVTQTDGAFCIIQRYKFAGTLNNGWDGETHSPGKSDYRGNKVNHGTNTLLGGLNGGNGSDLSKDISGLAVGNDVILTVEMTDYNTYNLKLEKSGCPSYSYHYGNNNDNPWKPEPICFTQVGSTSEWQIANFTIDAAQPQFYVGYQGYFYNDNLGTNNSRSSVQSLSSEMYFAQTQNSSGPKVGNATGAVGTIRIHDNSNWNNLFVGFIPNGYGLMYGANATENSIALKATAVGTVFMTDDVTLTADMLKTDGSYKYQVGLATATAGQYVACDNSEKANMGSMGSYVTDAWKDNLNLYTAGDKGKFRIWIDKTNKNWLCHFVPYWTLKYDLNGESGTAPQGAEVFSEASQQDRTITITSTVPQATHKVFDGWYTQATGGDKVTGSIELTKHTTLFAHWTNAPQWTVSFDSDGGSAVASQTVWNGETATEPSPAPTKTDLSLKEWQLNGVKYDFSTPVTANITLKAIWSDVCDMTDVKYAEPTVAQMTANNLFDEDDNTEPAQLTKCQIKVGSQGSNVAYYDANDANGYIKHGEGSSDAYYWYKIEAGTASYATDGKIYYFKNVSNGKYLRVVDGNFGGGNWDWKYVITDTKTDANNDRCKWFFKSSNGNARLVNFASKKSDNNAYQTGEHFLHRYEVNSAPCNTYVVAGSSDGNQGNWQLTTSLINSSTVDNPNYLKEKVEQGGKTYYRFANNAVVSTILPKALKAEDKITVYYYATAATTAELRINGTKVADITITSAGVNTYVYTALAGDAGQTAVAVASNSTSFLMAQIEVARPTPTSPRASNLAWDTDLSVGVTRMVDAGAFTHTATAKGAGAITYSSSNEDVATVATNGTVTPVAAGTTVIKATLEQDGCYEGKEITYNVTLTDLPKPTITFTTVPSEMPQGAVQQVIVTTTAGKDFALAITSGTGATLTITESTATQITANLAMGVNATNIELTASTKRVDGVVAQHAVAQTVNVSQCIPDGSDIFSFTFSTSDAANAQPATGLVGGSVSQTALGTAGTTDNPKMVNLVKLKMNKNNPDGKWFAVDKGAGNKAEIQSEGNTDLAQWYMIPVGATYSPQWKNNANYELYYLKNKQTGNYLRRGTQEYNEGSADWRYFTTITATDNSKTDDFKWFVDNSKDNDDRMVCRAGAGESLTRAYLLNTCNQHHNICDAVAPKPAIICGHTSDVNAFTRIYDLSANTTSAANPDMFKSVQYNSKTYYIVSSEGAITINCAIKEGDKIRIDTYDRKTEQANVVEITAQSDMSSYVYTSTNEYLCVAGITIFRPKYGEYTTPTLTWDTDLSEPQLVDLNNGGVAATHTATSNVATIETIAYSSNNSYITVDATTGAVSVNANTPDHEEATITATLPAVGCYDEATTTYTILVKNVQAGSLQDAIDDIEDGGTLTLDWDYIGSDAKIDNKKMTIDAGGHKIGNLTITTTGDLTLSSAMTANDFVIESSQVEPVSGQLKGADKLTVAGSAYMDLSFGAEAVTAGWYAFTVPFAVSSTGGVYNANTGAKLTNETDYAIMHYQGDVRAQGQYGWIKTHKKGGVMQPGTLYIIAFGDTEYNKIRFKKASGALNTNTVAVHQYGGGTETDNGWNGVGNPSLAYGNATNTGGAEKAQFLDHASNAFVISEQEITDQTYVVSSAFFIQANTDDNMTFTVPDNIGELMAPRRASANKEFMLELSQGAQFQDRLYLSVSEEAKDEYEIGHDLVKMSAVNGNATVAQMAIEGYDMNLCDAEFPMSEEVLFPLVLSAPKAGEYTLSVQRACAEQGLFVVNDGVVVWDLKQGDYTLDLQKGTTYDYSLMLQTGERTMPTGTDVIRSANGVQKIILRQELRIIRDGKMFNAQGIEL